MTTSIDPLVGRPIRRVEDEVILRGAARYFDDLPVDGLLHLVFLRSSIAHARVTAVETDEARSMPGVVAVLTNRDLGLPKIPPRPGTDGEPDTYFRPALANDVVRFVGEPVLAIVATTYREAVDAAEAVVVDYDALPVVVDPESACAPGAPLLFPETGTNVCLSSDFGGEHDVLAGADVVVRARLVNQRMAPVPMEGDGIVAEPDGDGLRVHVPVQLPWLFRGVLAPLLGLAPEQVRVLVPHMGGGFGAKALMIPEHAVVARAAQLLGRPVKWTETRSENLVAMGHARGQVHHAELGLTRDGSFVGLRVQLLQDAGGYAAVAPALTGMTRLMGQGVYRIPRIEWNNRAVLTNTTPVGGFRGAGRPESTELLERIIDIAADELDIDPVELRRKNLLAKDEFPLTTVTGASYDTGDYALVLDTACGLAGYDGLRAEQAERRRRGDAVQLGIGVSVYVEVSAQGMLSEFAGVEIHDDGSATLKVGTVAHGQGHQTTFSQIVHDLLGIPMDRIRFIQGDTGVVDRGAGTGGSRSLQVGGSAVRNASLEVLDRAKQLAAHLLEASVEDMVAHPGGVGVVGAPARAVSWAELAQSSRDPARRPLNLELALKADLDFDQEAGTFPFGAHVAVVEVDTETGGVRLLRHVAVDDCGNIVNPLLVDGQLHGGIANGAGHALFEGVVYDDDGNPLTGNLMDYAMPSAAEFPSFEVATTVTPTPRNPLGAKGIGESGTLGATPAVHNAVVDALSHLGVRDVEMPLSARRVWESIRAAAG